MPRMPGEFAPHERTVIAWPTRDDVYGKHLDEAREAHAALARTISGYEPVTMIANRQEAEYAAELCGSTVDVVALPIDDSWFRDSGPIYVFDGGERIAGNWIFNGWGQKFVPFDKDAAVASAWAKLASHPVRNIDMVLEGGSITSDGAGLLATTEQCLLHPNRNPHLSKNEIEQRLRSEFDLNEVMWLPHGLSMDADTDGHVDNVAIFIAPRTMVFQTCDDKSLSDHLRLEENRKVAQSFGVTMHEIPVLPVIEYHGERMQVPYLNFYMINGAVIVPVCGHAADDDMLALIGEYIPDRDIIGLNIGGILAYGGGGIHCITQQIPAVL
jgi:agmatine deiminase